jgi:hypothetical protein
MQPEEIEIEIITIDPRKADYIRSKGVEPEDVFEVQFNAPRYFRRLRPGGLYNMIGPNRRGRFLWVSIEPVVGTQWRLITA